MPSPREKILITGSEGLIGNRLKSHLLNDYDVIGFDVAEPEESPPGFDWIRCDLTDDANVAAAVEDLQKTHGRKLASVIHLAAYYDFSGEPSPLYEELTVEGSRRIARALREQMQLEQFIFSSSLLAMEPVEEGERIDEKSPTRAEWDYPQSKLEAEQALQEELGEIPLIILRIAGVYDDECHSLPISQQIKRIYEKQMESYVFPGDADHGQSFIHMDDLVRCFAKVIQRRGEIDHDMVYVIGEPDVMSYSELQDQIGELLHGHGWPALRVPKAVAKVGAWVEDKLSDDGPFIKPWMIDLADDHYAISIKKARQELGWEPQHSLRETLPEMIRCLQDDPRRWYEINGLEIPKKLEA